MIINLNHREMIVKAAAITKVFPYRTVNGRNGQTRYYQDFIARWNDAQSGKECYAKFTVINEMNIIGKLSENLLVNLEFTLTTNEKNGKVFTNTNILKGTLHCVGWKGTR